MNARALALDALERWRNGTEFADRIVAELFPRSGLSSPDRAFALELFYGVLRNFTLLDFWIAQLRPRKVDPGTGDLLRLGLYQILLLKTAAHAAVFETVALAHPRVRPVVNAILRRALREDVALTKAAEGKSTAVRFSLPEFLVEKWTRQFGEAETIELCRWNNQPAPVYARLNLLQTTAKRFLEEHAGSELLPGNTNFVRLSDPRGALEKGDCYIQDPSTALACELLQPKPGEKVLDACAAPGGKSAYLAQMMANEGDLLAADQDEKRLERVHENFVRLGVQNARRVCCDWRSESARAGIAATSFDRILVDVPCTNTGVMRRRVDVRWRLRPEDFRRLPDQQVTILRAVAPLLKTGGSLVYSTCSLEPEENEEVVAEFLAHDPAFRLVETKCSLPFRDYIDGAFAALLQRP